MSSIIIKFGSTQCDGEECGEKRTVDVDDG